MKQKQRIALLGIIAGSLISAACGSDKASNTMTDSRDGQTYKTVVIGTQTWMAENLNYAVSNSWCYNNEPENCGTIGRLYQWTGAMGIDSAYNSTTWGNSNMNHQGICPDGWHLPSNAEWQTLYSYVNANNGSEGVGTSLKSSSGWKYDPDYTPLGSNLFGFSALPAGEGNTLFFNNAGDYAYFWSAMELNPYGASVWHLSYSGRTFINIIKYKSDGFSVRCLNDSV